MLVFTVICVRRGGGRIDRQTHNMHTYTHTHLVLPLKLRPHLAELCVSTGGRLDVVHDVDVDVVQYDHVPVRRRPDDVIHCTEQVYTET